MGDRREAGRSRLRDPVALCPALLLMAAAVLLGLLSGCSSGPAIADRQSAVPRDIHGNPILGPPADEARADPEGRF